MRALSTDFLLREQFVTDPAGMFGDYVGGKALSPEATSASNHLLYAIVSNPQMLGWVQNLADGGADSDLSDASIARSLVTAVSKSGDEAVVSSLIKFGSSGETSIQPALGLVRNLALALRGAGRRAGTEFTPGTGTNVSPGTGANVSPASGTEATPGTGTNVSPSTGTNVSPGTGTNVSPGTGTNVSPASGTEATPGTGTNVSPGTGTNVSPGTGTNVSPGTGTNVSIGGIFGRFGEFQVILASLVDYANELRRAGALTETGFE